MSRASRREKREGELAALERDFRNLLVHGLRDTREGFHGVFGHQEHLDPRGKSKTRQALLEMHDTIDALRSELGYASAFELGERLRTYSAMRGSNVPGEPKLADAFLKELGEA